MKGVPKNINTLIFFRTRPLHVCSMGLFCVLKFLLCVNNFYSGSQTSGADSSGVKINSIWFIIGGAVIALLVICSIVFVIRYNIIIIHTILIILASIINSSGKYYANNHRELIHLIQNPVYSINMIRNPDILPKFDENL